MGLFIDEVILQGIFVVYNFMFTMLSKDIKLMLCQPSVVSAVSRWGKSYDVAWCIWIATIKEVSALFL